jgi:hypothetical protein
VHGRALLELCFRVRRSCSGEQRTQSHPEFCAACSRQRARITTAGDALASIASIGNQAQRHHRDASLSLIRRETSVLSGGEASAVVSMRPDKKINFTLSQPAALRLVGKISCWCPRLGAPPGAVALRPARWLRWCAKCHRVAAVLAKGLPNRVLATVTRVVVVAVVLPRGRRRDFDHVDPDCQYIDAGKTHRWRSRRAKAAGDGVRHARAVGPSQQAPLLRWLEDHRLRCGQTWPASTCRRSSSRLKAIKAGELAAESH